MYYNTHNTNNGKANNGRDNSRDNDGNDNFGNGGAWDGWDYTDDSEQKTTPEPEPLYVQPIQKTEPEIEQDIEPELGGKPQVRRGRIKQKHGRGRKKSYTLATLAAAVVLILTIIVVARVCFGYELHMVKNEHGISISIAPGGHRDDSDSHFQPPEEGRESFEFAETESTFEQAPLGDGTVLTISPSEGCTELSNQEIFKKCSVSIVSVSVAFSDGLASGTGVIMTENGYIITNCHVVQDALSVYVATADGVEYEAKLVGLDAQTDLAVLKIDASGLCPAEFGDSALVEVGDDVTAIGNPLGQNLSMTKGIISGIDRSVNSEGYTMTLLQTSAQINSGNSGGALINIYGQVIGITNMKLSTGSFSEVTVEGIGFAIPTATVKSVTDALIEYGYVSGRPALGITVRSIPSVAAAYYDTPTGLMVVAVSKNSDCYNQGLREGDLITQVEGEAIEDSEQLKDTISGMEVGDVLQLTVYRDGETFDIGVTLVESTLVNTSVDDEE